MKFTLQTTFSSSQYRQAKRISQQCKHLTAVLVQKDISLIARRAKIQTIGSFLSMEGNDLSEKEVTKILAHQALRLPDNEIQEVKNIAKVYDCLSKWDPLSVRDLKNAHRMLMIDLDAESGQWRKSEVQILEGKKIVHTPPLPKEISMMMKQVFSYIRGNKQISWLLKACILHYGIQYIHPFIDGNGRIGRIWQHLLMLKESSVFRYVLIGNIIKQHASEYYRSLDKSDKQKDPSIFVDFCLHYLSLELNKFSKKLAKL
ncbi:MAG: Fic family protein [Proteobacteria bacterium]|nr:Fic family protein [Pseudomonadota bacterium]